MSISDKLIAIAENESQVFEAGKRAVLKASRHMNATASGAVVAVNDVSPIEHGVTVKLSSDTVTDFSEVTVKRYGANLFNIGATDTLTKSWSDNAVARAFRENTWYIGLTSNNYWSSNSVLYTLTKEMITVTPKTNGYGITQAFRCKPQQEFYFSCDKPNEASCAFAFYDADGNWLGSFTQSSIAQSSVFTTPDNCYWLTVILGGKRDVGHTFSKVHLSLSPITEYEPYTEPTAHTANADGTVDGVKSISPSMTLTTDVNGVTVECSYLRDIDRYIDSLTGGK